MYELLHRHKRIAVIVIGVATLGFFLWLFLQGGFTDLTSGGKCVAQVNGECITLREYRRELLRYSHLLENKELERLVRQQILENLIAQTLLYQKALELGFRASDEEVVQTIKSDPTFQENGVFSSYKYKETLAKNGLELSEYEDYIRKLLSIQKLLTLLQNAVYMTEQEMRVNLAVNNVEISGRLYVITPSDIQQKIEPTEKELLEYYEKNKERFKKEDTKLIRVWAQKDKERAGALYKDVKEGKEISGYTQYALPKDNSNIPPTLLKLAESLSEKDAVSITKLGDEYYVIQLYKYERGSYKSFSEVREEVRRAVVEAKAKEVLLSQAKTYAENMRRGDTPQLKYFTFADTPLSQVASLVRIDQKDLVMLAFSKEKVFGPYALAQGYGILYIEGRKEKPTQGQDLEQVKRELINLKTNSIINWYIQHLEKSSKVKVFETQ